MRKRIVSLLLAVCLVCGLMGTVGPVAYAEEVKGLCGNDLSYTLDLNTGHLRVFGTGPMTDYWFNQNPPWSSYAKSIKSITVEDGVTSIGDEAFSNLPNLTAVNLADSVQSIGDESFYWNQSLTTCNMPRSLTTLKRYAFYNCQKLQGLDLPTGLTTIGYAAFSRCESITKAHVPGSVKAIEASVFQYCYALEDVVLGEGMEELGNCLLQDTAIKRITVPSTVVTMGEDVFSHTDQLEYCNMIGGGKELPRYTFSSCVSLKRVKLCNSVESVENAAFSNCASLTRLDFPSSVKRIWICSEDCPNLRIVTVANPECELAPYAHVFGEPTAATLYSANPSTTREYAVNFGHDWQLLGSEPEDDWDPNAEPTPTPDPTQKPSPTPGPSGEEPADQFKDVPANHYARNAINWAVANKITGGMSTNLFGVGKNCDRSQAVFFIWAAEGRPEPTLTQNPFVDVKPGAYYYKAVLWAKENGVTGGMDSTHFGPTGNVTRGQIMTFLYAAQGKPPVSSSGKFTDVKSSDYYSGPVSWAAENGISSGKGSSTTFKPKDNCKREEIVTFLFQAYK